MGLARTAAAALSLVFLVRPSAAEPGKPSQSVCAQVDSILKTLTGISGLPQKRATPCEVITREKVNEFLNQRIKEAVSPEEIRSEELTLKKFGFVPAGFDLAKTTVDLLTEQAAAFYDYNKRKLFITGGAGVESQEPVLAHELAHALADQSFNLKKFIKQGRSSDDGSSARLAVMEGQATWLMSEYVARGLGQSLRKSPELAAAMSALSDGAAGQYPVFDRAPLYLRRTLVFPYVKGLMFQQEMLARLGDEGFRAVFRKPPVSTQQIAHPEKYLAGVRPTEPELPGPRLPRGYKPLVGGSLGELEHSVLIEQFESREAAEEIAPHWRGCAYELRESRKAGRVVMLYAVEWDGEEAARRYFAFYKRALSKKWKSFSITEETADSAAGGGDDGRFELRRRGVIVTSAEGLPPEIN